MPNFTTRTLKRALYVFCCEDPADEIPTRCAVIFDERVCAYDSRFPTDGCSSTSRMLNQPVRP
jgi:hypothetical protein